MLQAYRVFYFGVILVGSCIATVVFSRNTSEFPRLLVMLTGGTGVLVSLYFLWILCVPARWKTRKVQVAYASLFVGLSVASSAVAAYLVARFGGVDLIATLTGLLLIGVSLYMSSGTFVRPLRSSAMPQKTVVNPELLGALLAVVFILLIGRTTYHLIMGY